MLNRRHFLLTGTSTLAAMAAAPNAISAPITAILDSPTTNVTKSVFQQYQDKLHDSFLLRHESGFKRVTLTALEKGPMAKGLEQFTLVFNGQAPLQGDLYKVTHLKTMQTTLLRVEPSQVDDHISKVTFSLLV